MKRKYVSVTDELSNFVRLNLYAITIGFENFPTVTLGSGDDYELADVLPEYLLHLTSFEINPSQSVVSHSHVRRRKSEVPTVNVLSPLFNSVLQRDQRPLNADDFASSSQDVLDSASGTANEIIPCSVFRLCDQQC
jgi:hypothetical protein